MYFNYKIIIADLFVIIILLICGCETKVYPDERFNIDSSLIKVFNSILQRDTFSFKNSTGSKKSFVISKVDSIISNKNGWFINEKPYKLLRINFKEVEGDTTFLERSNQIFINRDAATNTNTICIQFNNFYYFDSVLPPLNRDTINMNNQRLTNYYSFETSIRLKNSNDINVLYVKIPRGLIGFKTLSGEIWDEYNVTK